MCACVRVCVCVFYCGHGVRICLHQVQWYKGTLLLVDWMAIAMYGIAISPYFVYVYLCICMYY